MHKHLQKSKYKILSPCRGNTKADAARQDHHTQEVYASGKHGKSRVSSKGQQEEVRMFQRYCKQEQRNSGDNKAGTYEDVPKHSHANKMPMPSCLMLTLPARTRVLRVAITITF